MLLNGQRGSLLMAGACAAALGAASPDTAHASCLKEAAGAWLATITSGPTVTSRSTVLFNAEGTMSVVDSGQGTIGFTAAQGAWDCQEQHGKRALRATGLDFNTAGDMVFRTSYQATFDAMAGTIAGTISLRSFSLLADPLGSGGTALGTFAFTARRILAD